jgi:hypothetical protein
MQDAYQDVDVDVELGAWTKAWTLLDVYYYHYY